MLFQIIINKNSWYYETDEKKAYELAERIKSRGNDVEVIMLVPKEGEFRRR